MDIIKRFSALLLVAIMTISAMSINALAEESTAEVIGTYDFEITADTNANSNIVLASTSSVDNTFNVYLEHQGSTRNYSGSKLRYEITITDTNGNPVSNILAVQLYNSSNYMLAEDQFWADGITHIVQGLSISSSQSYYFKYVLAYGTARTLRVHMVITAY